MKNLMKISMYELLHDNLSFIMIGIMILQGILFGTGYLDSNYLDLPEGGFEVCLSMFYDSTAEIIIIGVFTSVLIGKSFSERTLLNKIMSGYGRKQVLLSKSICIILFACLCMIIYPICGALRVFLTSGWNAPYTSLYTLLKIIISTIFLDGAIFSLIVLPAVIFRNNTKIIICGSVLLFINALILAYGKSITFIRNIEPMCLLRVILSNNSIIMCLACIIYSMALLGIVFGISYNIFKRCELK